MTRTVLDAQDVRRWVDSCVAVLEQRRSEIDALNVFPVPDSDTGTNMSHTLTAAAQRMHAEFGAGIGQQEQHGAPPASQVLTALAAGAVDGARGNSGIILSQILRGFAQVAGSERFAACGGALDAVGLRTALAEASGLARAAVSMPMEGTILTVLSEAARGCAGTGVETGTDGESDGSPEAATVEAVAQTASEAAFVALGQTTRQLDVLEAAGVVDAGGAGLLLILDCLVETLTGSAVRRPVFERAARARLGHSGASIATVDLAGGPSVRPGGGADAWQEAPGALDQAPGDADRGGLRTECPPSPDDYEVMYLLDGAPSDAVTRLRRELERIGNSVVIVGDGAGGWSVHVHLAEAGLAVDRGLEAGRIRNVRITHLGVQQRAQSALRPGRAVLAVVNGPDASALFEEEGAQVLAVEEEASGKALLDAIVATEAGEVLLLPNGNVRAEDLVVVSAAARRHGQQVLPLPCSSMVQGLASIAVHDPNRPSSDDTYAMAEAASATRSARLRIAEERALTWSGTCAPGDALGVIGDEIMVVEPRVETAATTLLDLMLGTGGELVTVLVGAATHNELVAGISGHVEAWHPAVELAVHLGGQADDVLQIGVE
ncbi:MAG: DAK2 domain-containing protein [Tomitella sp.]|nr:DAK2 domain-containing protein [Tomitella sp.]